MDTIYHESQLYYCCLEEVLSDLDKDDSPIEEGHAEQHQQLEEHANLDPKPQDDEVLANNFAIAPLEKDVSIQGVEGNHMDVEPPQIEVNVTEEPFANQPLRKTARKRKSKAKVKQELYYQKDPNDPRNHCQKRKIIKAGKSKAYRDKQKDKLESLMYFKIRVCKMFESTHPDLARTIENEFQLVKMATKR